MPSKTNSPEGAKGSASGGRGSRFNLFMTKQVLTPLVVLTVLVAFLLVTVTYTFNRFRKDGEFIPENSLPIMLLIGTVALLVTLAVVTTIFARLGLTTYKQALGLPEGSVRAIIALLLILLFFVTRSFSTRTLGEGETAVL